MNGRDQLLRRIEDKIKKLGLALNRARVENLRLEQEIERLKTKKTDQEQLLFDYESSSQASTSDTDKVKKELVEIQNELNECMELVKGM